MQAPEPQLPKSTQTTPTWNIKPLRLMFKIKQWQNRPARLYLTGTETFLGTAYPLLYANILYSLAPDLLQEPILAAKEGEPNISLRVVLTKHDAHSPEQGSVVPMGENTAESHHPTAKTFQHANKGFRFYSWHRPSNPGAARSRLVSQTCATN